MITINKVMNHQDSNRIERGRNMNLGKKKMFSQMFVIDLILCNIQRWPILILTWQMYRKKKAGNLIFFFYPIKK